MRKKTGLVILIFLGLLCTAFSHKRNSDRNNWHDNKYSMFIQFGI